MVRLITPQVYSATVLRAIQHATKRVYVLSLIIQQENDTSDIITALTRASHRGVEVSVLGDFSTHIDPSGSLNPYRGFTKSVQTARDMANRLRAANIDFRWLGTRSPLLFAGRTHSKWIITDNEVFSFGGINLHSSFAGDTDFMFHIHDPHLADILATEHMSIQRADSLDTAYASTSIQVACGLLLIDGGLPLDSIIYRQSVKLTQESSEVLMVTQYCPTGQIARAIKQTDYSVFYNTPTTQDFFTNALIKVSQAITDIPNAYTRQPYLHAKFMIATHPDGTKTAITGSHNFISYGGVLGTREIALRTSDPLIIGALEQYYKKYVA